MTLAIAASWSAQDDSRVNVARLRRRLRGSLPAEPAARNAEWHVLYTDMRDVVAVKDVNRVVLRFRDEPSLAFPFIPLPGTVASFLVGNAGIAAA